VCFHSEDKLRTVLWQFAGMQYSSKENDLLDRVGNLNLEELLAKFLTEQEIAAIRDRIARLRLVNKFPNPSDQWPAVPWPPV